MRKFIVVILIVVALVAGLAIYLSSTTPSSSRGVRVPLTASQRALVAQVPESAESFALIPSAAALTAKLRANAVTREPLEEWEKRQAMPPMWAIGAADLVIWKEGSRTAYAVQLDSLRALLVRLYLMLGSDIDARWNGSTLLINAGDVNAAAAGATAPALLDAASSLPRADVLAVQRATSRGAFPPIGRPAITAISLDADTIVLTSRAARTTDATAGPLSVQFPRGAMIASAFVSPPRVITELNRLFGREISTLLADGGAIAIYDVDTHKLLPRPNGVVIMPATEERRAALAKFQKTLSPVEAIGVDSYVAESGNKLLLAFDRSSNDTYIKDAFAPARTWPSAEWAVRIDPQRLVPVLEKLGDNVGFRIAAPKLYRSARDLSRWIHYLRQAKSIEAAATAEGPFSSLEVRISSK
ncbi:MAG: hypothetical protein JWO97_4005 [Acidobacteria bacterium]|nr:hypothetical protein [Acidobacteriota bacterium]